MALLEGKTPKERKQIIAAIVLGAIAFGWLGYIFLFASSGSNGTPRQTSKTSKPTQTTSTGTQIAQSNEPPIDTPPQPLDINWQTADAPSATRNIFAYFVAPPSTANLKTTPKTDASQTPTPAPTPPWILAGVSPSNVTARTGDFKLEVTGDKFTSAAHIYIDGQELPTQFTSPQRVAANVPASFIASPGARQIVVRSSDGQLFSNTATLNIAVPPAPLYTYIGLLGRRPGARGGKDTALLKKQGGGNDDVISVQRGDTVGGRFRVTNISERAIEFTDTQLGITHTLYYTETGEPNSFSNQRGRTPRIVAPGAIQPVDSDEP